jgi:hypothetical protein
MIRLLRIPIIPLLLILAACSEAPPIPEPPPQPISGLSAFHKMFITARSWALDAEPLRVSQLDVSGFKALPGEAFAWEAVFVSQSKASVRRYIYSAIHRPERNLRGGITADPPESWSGRSSSEPFLVQAFRVDSTAAYKTALKHAPRRPSAAPVRFLLEKTNRFPDPAWRVFWGESVAASSLTVFIDAATGDFLGADR